MCRGGSGAQAQGEAYSEVDAELDAIMAMPAEALAEELPAMAWRKRAIWRCDKGTILCHNQKKPRSQCEASALFVPWYGGYERVSILAWHLGAGDADLAFALGNGEHLAAVGALR